MIKRILIVLALVLVILAGLLVYLVQATKQLSGVVLDAATQQPIANAQLRIADRGASTNDQGEYSIDVPYGIHLLDVEADGYVPVQMQVNGDELFTRTLTVDVILGKNRVVGTVRDAETNQPLQKVQVVVGGNPVTTDASGTFEAYGITSGTTFTVQTFGYQPTTITFDGQMNLDVSLVPISFNIRAVDKSNNQPIANAQIKVGDQTFATDAQGQAILRRIKPGTPIQAFAPGFENASAAFAGQDVQLAMRRNTFDGVIKDSETSQPISGTLVYFNNTIVTTNAQGTFHLDQVPANSKLTLRVAGYSKTEFNVGDNVRADIKVNPFKVKGIHIPFGIPADQIRELIDMVGKTELNAIVIDVKAEKGRLAWDSQVPLAKQIGAPYINGVDLLQVVERCRTENIYCIARMPVFQDHLLAMARPNLAIRLTNGAIFVEPNGLSWLNPYQVENWNYNIALAKEIAAMGFDEIQFDYVRFPGLVNNVDWGTENTEAKRVATITGFLAQARKELLPSRIFISADVFGLTTATNDDQNTGQRLRDLAPYVDYVSPMVYPDVWVNAADMLANGLGIKNCSDAVRCPYDVIYNSYKRSTEKTSTKIRLWLQAYSGRGNYGLNEYRIQKKAATDAGSYGWMYWNGAGTYDVRLFESK